MPASSRAAVNLIVTENGAAPDDPLLPTYAEVYNKDDYYDIDEDNPALSHEGGEHSDATRAAHIHLLDGYVHLFRLTRILFTMPRHT